MSASIEGLAGAATAAASAGLANKVSTRVARITLDNAEQQGQALVALVRSAGNVQANTQNRASSTGSGAGLDLTA